MATPRNNAHHRPAWQVWFVALCLVVAALGALLLWVRPFRPDLGDTSALVDPMRAKAAGGTRRPYRWWTGEPVRAHEPPSN